MVGRQTSRGVARYTFEIEYLASGFNLIVVIVGIFALSQALNLMNGKDTDPPETKITKGLFKGLAELKKYPAVAFISASFGTVMGIIPGVGEFVAQFFSYSTARSLSKNPSKFGYGAPEGLIAGETSNNADPAAAMIPLLALGVPGEALTAMMMVVFFDAGIKPGPDIFEKAPDFLFSLFIALLFINILVVITLLFTSRFIAKIIYIPNKFLGAFIMILAFVGVFSIRNNLKVGEYLTLLFFNKKNKSIPKIRKFNIKFIYDTGIKEFDSKIVFGNFNQSMQINNWSINHAGGIEVRLSSDSNLELIYESVPSNYKIMLNRDRFGEIYNWISLFDSNVYLIVFLMILVGGINMITALLITILEKRKFIGVLKVLGANNSSVRKIFLINGAYLIIRGLVIGNLISFMLLFLQHQFNIIELDPTVYYVNSVPVDLNFINIILLNISVIVTSFLMLIIPSLVVSKLNPTTTMKSS